MEAREISRGNSPSSLEDWVERLRTGDPLAVARTISAIENGAPDFTKLLQMLFRYSGRARVIGITGAPGAGKSTLVDQLAGEYRKQERTVGIIAVDPTSPFSGGAILGDRIRMMEHHADPGIFIRSMATRGFLGGVARATTDAVTVLDASGKDVILVETVGVGQDEVDIARLADITVLILVPGMGDDVQTIKAGIMEIANIFVINKSDREGADRVEREIRAMQSLAPRTDGWTPAIVKTVATEGKGMSELTQAIVEYQNFLVQQNLLLKKRIANWRERLVEMLRDKLLHGLFQERLDREELSQLAADVAEHRRDPYALVEEIVGSYLRAGER
jgi:LAO/AO transport system kinase